MMNTFSMFLKKIGGLHVPRFRQSIITLGQATNQKTPGSKLVHATDPPMSLEDVEKALQIRRICYQQMFFSAVLFGEACYEISFWRRSRKEKVLREKIKKDLAARFPGFRP